MPHLYEYFLSASCSVRYRGWVKALPHTHSCFVCGESNPMGLKLRFQTDGRIVECRFRPRAEHVGFQRTVHGGLIGAVLDEIMVWACAVQTRRFSYCAEMTVRFRHPARPGSELRAIGEMLANRRGRIFEARAHIQDETGQVLAVGEGKYVPVALTDLAGMEGELIGDSSWLYADGEVKASDGHACS